MYLRQERTSRNAAALKATAPFLDIPRAPEQHSSILAQDLRLGMGWVVKVDGADAAAML